MLKLPTKNAVFAAALFAAGYYVGRNYDIKPNIKKVSK